MKKKCELKPLVFKYEICVWDNGINPLDRKVSIINRKISKEDFILKLTKLGFIINEHFGWSKSKQKERGKGFL